MPSTNPQVLKLLCPIVHCVAALHAGAAARGEYQAHTLQILVADVPGVLQQVRCADSQPVYCCAVDMTT